MSLSPQQMKNVMTMRLIFFKSYSSILSIGAATSHPQYNGLIVRAIWQPISKSLKELIVSMIVEHIFRLSFCLLSFLISRLKFFVTSHVTEALCAALHSKTMRLAFLVAGQYSRASELCAADRRENENEKRTGKNHIRGRAPAVVDLLTSKCPRLHQRRSSISTLWKIALVHPFSCQRSSRRRNSPRDKTRTERRMSPQLLITQEKREHTIAASTTEEMARRFEVNDFYKQPVGEFILLFSNDARATSKIQKSPTFTIKVV